MTLMTHIWSCSCGLETKCEAEDQRLGAVWHCDNCGKSFGCVRPRHGGKEWVNISEADAKFHRLFDEPEPEDV